MDFDLFKLHDVKMDTNPKSWICASGERLYPLINGLVLDLNVFYSKNRVSIILAKKLKCSVHTITRRIYNKNKWIPIILIIELSNLWKQKLNKSNLGESMINSLIILSIFD